MAATTTKRGHAYSLPGLGRGAEDLSHPAVHVIGSTAQGARQTPLRLPRRALLWAPPKVRDRLPFGSRDVHPLFAPTMVRAKLCFGHFYSLTQGRVPTRQMYLRLLLAGSTSFDLTSYSLTQDRAATRY